MTKPKENNYCVAPENTVSILPTEGFSFYTLSTPKKFQFK